LKRQSQEVQWLVSDFEGHLTQRLILLEG